MRSGSGPEATVNCFSFQLGMWLTEIGPLYDWPNKTVILLVENAAPRRLRGKQHRFCIDRPVARSCAKALADASLRRDHEWRVKLP